jgi:2-polyprenyl-3-methyl-5-hydroxy-6-metoxy-1,4-benzoquinol methylase
LSEKIKNIVKDITPPIILRKAKSLMRHKTGSNIFHEESGEKSPEWYDKSFDAANHWRSHYTESNYHFLWTVIADRIITLEIDSILDVGCGPGQFASLLRDKGIKKYLGFDFSHKRIAQAKIACPAFTFLVEDAYQTDLFKTYNYDAVVCNEFLEHVEDDIGIISRIKPGTKFLGTVPNFPFVSHVRHFSNESHVISRYKQCFSNFRVDSFISNAKGMTFYLIQGTCETGF